MEPPYLRMTEKQMLERDLEAVQHTEVIAIIYNKYIQCKGD